MIKLLLIFLGTNSGTWYLTQSQDCERRTQSDTKLSHGDSKTGSFHPTSLGQNARYCKSELCPVWQIHQEQNG